MSQVATHGKKDNMLNMKEIEYEYHVVHTEPTEIDKREKLAEGWELCDALEGVVGRDLEKEPQRPHSNFYFRKQV